MKIKIRSKRKSDLAYQQLTLHTLRTKTMWTPKNIANNSVATAQHKPKNNQQTIITFTSTHPRTPPTPTPICKQHIQDRISE